MTIKQHKNSRLPAFVVIAIAMMTCIVMPVKAQYLRPEYIDWNSPDDDAFFISRVRPHLVFRDTTTQVRTYLNDNNDKRLCMWMPIGTSPNNALPDGVFDRDAFSMWHYVTHLGNWSAPLARVPGVLTDVAHKNGVGVSATATIPIGELTAKWSHRLDSIVGTDDDVEPEAAAFADYLMRYGIDGIGYNSEFQCSPELVSRLSRWHEALLRHLRERNPLAEIIWYDGTNERGEVTYDNGIGTHNDDIFGSAGHERSNFFLNYNWNEGFDMQRTLDNIAALGRSPKDVYCGFNLQGREPRNAPHWTLLADLPFSIGLWGAHSENMLFETRNEQGFTPLLCQRTYQRRQELWFTGGSGSVIGPHPIVNSLRYDVDNEAFHGMSAMMSARSSLSWNLAEEPFVTSFNLGNGTAFYERGSKVSDHEWYNISLQDHLPTWRWWISPTLLERNFDVAPQSDITAELSWDDAYWGGSSLAVSGTTASQYIHLFKTRYAIEAGDRVSVVCKLPKGTARVSLVLVNDDLESVELPLECTAGEWSETTFTITPDAQSLIAGHTLSLVALHVEDAEDALLRIGRLSLQRGTSLVPQQPVLDRVQLLARHSHGIDAKVVYSTTGQYNIDSKTSLFRVYSQVEGGKIVQETATTSWAAIAYSVDAPEGRRVRMGVSAVGLDMLAESDIAWSEWLPTDGLPYYADEEQDDPADTVPDVYPATAGKVPEIRDMYESNEPVLDLRLLSQEPVRIVADADMGEGSHSRGLYLGGKAFGFRASDVRDADADFFRKQFSVSFWVKINDYHTETSLLNIRDKTDYWPYNDRGWFSHTVSKDGRSAVMRLRRKAAFGEDITFEMSDFRLTTGRWHHLAYVFDLSTRRPVDVKVYLDGRLHTHGNTATADYPLDDLLGFRSKNVVAVGGLAKNVDGVDGTLDDFTLWNRALTAADVADIMDGYTPEDYYCRWNFEHDADVEGCFHADGDAEDVAAFLHSYATGEREGEGELLVVKPELMPVGAPMAEGDAWQCVTVSRWDVAEHDSLYDITLTLTNDWGADTMTIRNLKSPEADAVKDVLRNDGCLNVRYYDLLGRQVAAPSAARRIVIARKSCTLSK